MKEDSLSAFEHYLSFIFCKFVSDAIRYCVSRLQNSQFFLSPVPLSVFSLVPVVPDLLIDCSRVLECAKIRTVLQSVVFQAYKSIFPSSGLEKDIK